MDILVKALSLIAIVAVGYAIKQLGWVKTSDFGIFAKIVLRITLPCALITAFNDYQMPVAMLGLSLIGFLVNLVMQLTGFFVERRNGRQKQAFAVINIPSFNMGAFATPYLAGFMGPAAVVNASLFDIGNALGAAGLGYAWGTGMADESRRTTPATFVRAMFSSVVFDVYLVLVLMKLLHLRLPDQVITFTSTVGAANTFLAMLMIGIGLEIKLARSQYASAAKYLGLRYALATTMALAIWFSPLPHQYRLLLVTVLYAPIAAMTPGFTDEIGGDLQLSTFMTSASIIVAIVMMPALMLALG